MNLPINLFLDLVELEKITAVFDSLLKYLHSHGMTDDYLKKYLVSLACDCAAVMLGCKSGVKKLLSERFPSIIVWHCANHRLELAVGDTVKKTSGTNKFKSFMDKLYVIYHASPKNSWLVSTIYPPDSWENVRRLSIGQLLPRPTFGDTGCTMSACYFVLSPVYMPL